MDATHGPPENHDRAAGSQVSESAVMRYREINNGTKCINCNVIYNSVQYNLKCDILNERVPKSSLNINLCFRLPVFSVSNLRQIITATISVFFAMYVSVNCAFVSRNKEYLL
jgi:hypothetical protein